MDLFAEFLRMSLLALLGLSGLVGLLAIASPQTFSTMAACGNRIIHLGNQPQGLGQWVDIDRYVLQHARLFGLAIVVTEGFIWFISHYGPETYSKSFMMIVVCVAVFVCILALGHSHRQKREIEMNLACANTDSLTGLLNRRAFDMELSRRLAQMQRQGTTFSLQLVDIDNFKCINDRYGHALGDATLKHAAEVFISTSRRVDIVARFGGDEFALLLPGCDLRKSSLAAERCRTAIGDRSFSCNGREIDLTISSGIAEAQVDDDPTSLLKRADRALYAAKEAGRNCTYRHGGPERATPDPAAI